MKLRVRIRSYNKNKLSTYAEVLSLMFRLRPELATSGPASLPTKIMKFTVNKSPHIDKKSRDQLEIRTHTKLFEIVAKSRNCVLRLVNFCPPDGVSVEVQLSN
ncbi:MAG: 30S ribosomal protein S10 [Candidatus Hodgkinia cicadicola]